MPERITITTDDEVIIVGDWVTSTTMLGAVVCVHMMPAMRESWALLQRELAKRNIASLAIDLRGHGESIKTSEGTTMDYKMFTDTEHQESLIDVMAAVDWVKSRGIELPRIALVGASIGANLALQMLAEEPKLSGAVLLSPGADYHGIHALETIENVLPHQRLLIVASEDDKPSFADSQKLHEAAVVDQKTFVPYKNAGHGTNILQAERESMKVICDWCVETIKG